MTDEEFNQAVDTQVDAFGKMVPELFDLNVMFAAIAELLAGTIGCSGCDAEDAIEVVGNMVRDTLEEAKFAEFERAGHTIQ